MKSTKSAFILFILILIVSCQSAIETKKPATAESPKTTIQDVERGIRANIELMTIEGDGYFNFKNDSMDLKLKLVRVHTEYLSVVGKRRFFACVDLATENGDVYDVDFFMEGEAENMTVTKTDVHKLNGKPYYTWKQAEDKTWITVPVKNASNKLLGVVEGSDQFTFDYEIKLSDIAGSAKMWVPVAKTDNYQTVELVSLEAPGKHQMLEDKENDNSILFLELLPEDSGKTISLRYKVSRLEKSPYTDVDINLDKYLGSTPFLPVGDRFKTIADEVIRSKEAGSELAKARALYDYVIDEVRYAKDGIFGTGDANYACDSKSGNCTEFHSFFISLARSAGIPSRFAVGASIPSERDEGGVDGYHCWAEFYADGKWWPVDISEANKYSTLATYYFGHHPANRIEFSKGRELSPDPLPKSGPINFLAYPVMEVEGEPDLVETTFTFKRTTVLD